VKNVMRSPRHQRRPGLGMNARAADHRASRAYPSRGAGGRPETFMGLAGRRPHLTCTGELSAIGGRAAPRRAIRRGRSRTARPRREGVYSAPRSALAAEKRIDMPSPARFARCCSAASRRATRAELLARDPRERPSRKMPFSGAPIAELPLWEPAVRTKYKDRNCPATPTPRQTCPTATPMPVNHRCTTTHQYDTNEYAQRQGNYAQREVFAS